MPDRLLSPDEAGERLGGISARAVRRLVEDGKLRAKYQPLRGLQPGEKGARPRIYIPETAIDAYIDSLPGPGELPSKRESVRRKQLPGNLRREIEEAAEYL